MKVPPLFQDLNALSEDDRQLIEAEHLRLEQFLSDLHETCSELIPDCGCAHCDSGKLSACQGRLPSFFYDFCELVSDHFDNEEKIMRDSLWSDSGYELLRQHNQEHARLMGEVKKLIEECSVFNRQGNVAGAIRHFHNKVTEMFGEHARTFDSRLLSRHVMTIQQ
jgi:hemerythrin